MNITLKYIFFAIIATIGNILAQEATSRVYDYKYNLLVAIFIGTIVGLVIKYILDKKYIFYHRTESIKQNTHMFLLYSVMGIFTTFIFWATEFTFDYFFQTKTMRYTGAIIGLAFGYWIKFYLDKRFVFREW